MKRRDLIAELERMGCVLLCNRATNMTFTIIPKAADLSQCPDTVRSMKYSPGRL